MPITKVENNSESVWVKLFANKTSHFVASLDRPPGGDLAKLESQLVSFKRQLEKIKDIHTYIHTYIQFPPFEKEKWKWHCSIGFRESSRIQWSIH